MRLKRFAETYKLHNDDFDPEKSGFLMLSLQYHINEVKREFPKRLMRATKIQLFDQDGDNCIKNLVTVRIEYEFLKPKAPAKGIFSKVRRRKSMALI